MDGPIPGQSLTKTPRNALYERAPEIVEPNDAIVWHMEKLSDPKRLDNLLFTLEYGLPVKHATQAALTIAVAKGIHNLDISLIIAPVIHKFIASTAKEAGIDYLDDFKNAGMKEQEEKEKLGLLLDKAISETPVEERDEGYEMLGDFAEVIPDVDTGLDTEGEISPEVEEVAEEVGAKPQRGLMARG